MKWSFSPFEFFIVLFLSITLVALTGLSTISMVITGGILGAGLLTIIVRGERQQLEEKYRLALPDLLDSRDAWSTTGERLNLTLSEESGLALSGTIAGVDVLAQVSCDSEALLTRITVTAPNLSSHLDRGDFATILKVIHSGSEQTLGSGRQWYRHNMVLEDSEARALLEATTLSGLVLSQGQLSGTRAGILTDELEATIREAVQLTGALRLALLMPLRNLARRLGLGVDAASGDMVGEVSGITVRITPLETRYTLAASVSGLPEDLTVSRRSPQTPPGLALGDPILDSMVVVQSPRSADREWFSSDLHGDLLTVVCEQEGAVRDGAVWQTVGKSGLEDALSDVVRLARALETT